MGSIDIESYHDDLPVSEEQERPVIDSNALSEMLNLIDQVSTDSKFDSLEILISHLRADKKADYICIVSSYVSPVSYLSSRLMETGLPVYQITGATPYNRKRNIYNLFRIQGGILVISAVSSLTGIDLRYVNSVIIYDLFGSKDMLANNAYTFIVRTGYGEICLFSEASGVLPYEQMLIGLFTGE
jgi:superfamily II DNA/RNA helicase